MEQNISGKHMNGKILRRCIYTFRIGNRIIFDNVTGCIIPHEPIYKFVYIDLPYGDVDDYEYLSSIDLKQKNLLLKGFGRPEYCRRLCF